MGILQRIFTSILPREKAAAAESESRAWIAKCDDCGLQRSVWDLGGIRWKASGTPRWRIKCPQCGVKRWHTLRFES
jgi:DNA-directed RNA polymerase subunit RPC12/RpoP